MIKEQSYTDYEAALAHAAAWFAAGTASIEMTILHDDGVYRHLRFAKPGTSIAWFEIVTWPRRLSITGDLNTSFTFSARDDMFTFFRAPAGWNNTPINPQYWAEKVISGRDGVEDYSAEEFRKVVDTHVADAVESWPALGAVDDDYVGLAAAVEAALTDDYDTNYADVAQEFLDNFTYHYLNEGKPAMFRFKDTWDWGDFTTWSHTYLRACNAIQWGIDQYDARKAAQKAAETAAAEAGAGAETPFDAAHRLAPLPETREEATTPVWARHYAALALAAHAEFRAALATLPSKAEPGSRPDIGYLMEIAQAATAAARAIIGGGDTADDLWDLTPELGSLNGEYLDWLAGVLGGLSINPAEIYRWFVVEDWAPAQVTA